MNDFQMMLGRIEPLLPPLLSYLHAPFVYPVAGAAAGVLVLLLALRLRRARKAQKYAPRVGLLNKHPWPALDAKAVSANDANRSQNVAQFLADDGENEVAPGNLHDRVGQLIRTIQQRRNSRVISIIHRRHMESSQLDLDDLEDVLTAIQETKPDCPLDIVLHTPGGSGLAGSQIARAIKAHPARKTAFVPYYAMSAGTLIALAVDEIVMSPHAALGPIDPQYGPFPAASIVRVADQKKVDDMGDDTLILADMSKKALVQAKEQACELMQGTYSHDGSCSITDELVSGRWTHDYPITVSAARELGLRVSTDMIPEVMELVHCFRYAGGRVPNVLFLS
jgi:ClpP class serine protease